MRDLRPLLLLFLVLTACTTAPPVAPGVHDRLATNRPTFAVNDGLDEKILGPVARAWIKVTPAEARDAISRSYHNLTFPGRGVSLVLQGEPLKVTTETGRFVVNTTAGGLGLFDVATLLRIPSHDADMGQTFRRWGVPPGDYVVVPIVGHFTVRDLVGGVLDLALNPLTWAPPAFMPLDALFAVNGRAQQELKLQAARAAALDRYSAARDAYLQQRVEDESSRSELLR